MYAAGQQQFSVGRHTLDRTDKIFSLHWWPWRVLLTFYSYYFKLTLILNYASLLHSSTTSVQICNLLKNLLHIRMQLVWHSKRRPFNLLLLYWKGFLTLNWNSVLIKDGYISKFIDNTKIIPVHTSPLRYIWMTLMPQQLYTTLRHTICSPFSYVGKAVLDFGLHKNHHL